MEIFSKMVYLFVFFPSTIYLYCYIQYYESVGSTICVFIYNNPTNQNDDNKPWYFHTVLCEWKPAHSESLSITTKVFQGKLRWKLKMLNLRDINNFMAVDNNVTIITLNTNVTSGINTTSDIQLIQVINEAPTQNWDSYITFACKQFIILTSILLLTSIQCQTSS